MPLAPQVSQTTTVAKGIEPVRIEIPKLRINAPVAPVGLLGDGSMGVPEDTNEVGWYEPGAKPGEFGNAVFAGHVDSYLGPAVFFYLKKLEVGDEVIIRGKNGETFIYVVTSKASYPYDQAPVEDIFGYTAAKRLNLITCAGRYDRKTKNHEERLVVYTELKE
ncbi:class F sortase [Ectobacillus sp. JY-23]|uniref:class F sortase n=1 Tax=Ectobacillus sp. JY-23 TaxID=2933872 RepID=UPI001FF2E10D|nr:class F sortase [Ectobacillus sp. JY-23]UOY93332.1 class F sortase [Ectobacillus sp. JY-23]